MREACRLNTYLACVLLALAQAAGRSEDFSFFEERIRPVLVESCYECHSIKTENPKGGLLLDSRDGWLKGGESGPAIISGNPAESLLFRAISHLQKDLQMPPEVERLSSTVLADFEKWIASGAPDPRTNLSPVVMPEMQKDADFTAFRQQWPFVPIQSGPLPQVKNAAGAKSDIDRYILAKLEEKNLRLSPGAEKRALLRRATFDLTGLPPTQDEIEKFLADDSAGAFEKVIDRLLASPQYGERWGRHWLDVVRYADSLDSRGIGGEGDIAEAYRYRDWVVDAFNADLPYDVFVRHQIAGDILSVRDGVGFSTNSLIATGVYAVGEWGTGDADKEKMLTDIVDDQIDLTGRAFLGLTISCARCHDHKFDPISTRDYYGLAGIFFSSRILPNPGVKTAGSPVLRIPLASPEAIAERESLLRQIKELEIIEQTEAARTMDLFVREAIPQTSRALNAAAEHRRTGAPVPPIAEKLGVPEALVEAWLSYLGWGGRALLDEKVEKVNGNPGVVAWRRKGGDAPSLTLNTTEADVTITTLTLPPRSVSVHPSPKSGAGIAWKSPVSGVVAITGTVADADDKCGDGIEWILQARRGGRLDLLAQGGIANGGTGSFAAAALNQVQVVRGDELELIIAPKGEYTCDTTAITLGIAEAGEGGRRWDLTRDALASTGGNPINDSFGNREVWAFFEAAAPRAQRNTIDPALHRWLETTDPKGRQAEAWNIQSGLVEARDAERSGQTNVTPLYVMLANPKGDFWRGTVSQLDKLPPHLLAGWKAARSQITDARGKIGPAFPVTHGFQEGGTPQTPYEGFHDARVHVRGSYTRLGEVVPRRFPTVLAGDDQPPMTKGSGRLELAHWIASGENPLTARVMVNRIWQHHFGEGIVRTPNNFGKLGTPPTHPELLDYLAAKFIASGWSIKAMHKLMMLSATYQQRSTVDPELLKADPENLLFGRMNRRRLDAEEIRDSLLAASGQLDRTLRGPAVRDLSTPRRTLYVMTVRSDRATYQAMFDAADPTSIVEKRTQSTVAPQALWLMNHPFAIAQAEALANRARERAESDSERIRWLYETLYGRPPGEQELTIGQAAVEQTGQMLSPGAGSRSSGWTSYCQALLWANEFVYVD